MVGWSSACNKAMREIFPSSLAQRKGKFKKYPLCVMYNAAMMCNIFKLRNELFGLFHLQDRASYFGNTDLGFWVMVLYEGFVLT